MTATAWRVIKVSHENAKSNATSAKCLIRKEELSRFYSVIGIFFQRIYKFEYIGLKILLMNSTVLRVCDLKMCRSMVMNLFSKYAILPKICG